MKVRTTLTGILIGLTAAACSSFQAYDGPPRPDEETALIRTTTLVVELEFGAPDSSAGQAYFTLVDDTALPNLARVRVLPGSRCITLRLVYTPASGEDTARTNSIHCFDAIAGREYEVRVRIPWDQPVRTWLVDRETDETVAEGQFQAS